MSRTVPVGDTQQRNRRQRRPERHDGRGPRHPSPLPRCEPRRSGVGSSLTTGSLADRHCTLGKKRGCDVSETSQCRGGRPSSRTPSIPSTREPAHVRSHSTRGGAGGASGTDGGQLRRAGGTRSPRPASVAAPGSVPERRCRCVLPHPGRQLSRGGCDVREVSSTRRVPGVRLGGPEHRRGVGRDFGQ